MNGRRSAVERFQAFTTGGEEPDLFEGALAIAAVVDPTEDLSGARQRIEELAEKVRRARQAGGMPMHEALRQVLFVEEGFCGDRDDYDDPVNSSVAHVLETRRGMPITLSIAVLEIARRTGLDLTGIGLPGHFVVGGPDLPNGLYLDPFDGGELRDAAGVQERVGSIFGTTIELPEEAFLPDSPRSILLRVLSNLRRSWEKRGKFEEALAALECAEALVPGDVSALREKGLLLLRLGKVQEAVGLLEAYVAKTGGEDAEGITKLIAVVRDRAGGSASPSPSEDKKIFTLDEAREALPKVREITAEAVASYESADGAEEQQQEIVGRWVRRITSLGLEVKGLWLVDFDSGAGYYCWKYPEPALEYFHGYEEGFAGRLPLQ
ncbi:MAG TPA: tetratricopeptide repeat protein [Thermoanaerobaculia bacterium]|nr:tetratricopeptide repeat protein [Thermoanaerobaculia bacterium]